MEVSSSMSSEPWISARASAPLPFNVTAVSPPASRSLLEYTVPLAPTAADHCVRSLVSSSSESSWLILTRPQPCPAMAHSSTPESSIQPTYGFRLVKVVSWSPRLGSAPMSSV